MSKLKPWYETGPYSLESEGSIRFYIVGPESRTPRTFDRNEAEIICLWLNSAYNKGRPSPLPPSLGEVKAFSHCRLEQEYLMAVVINRSGIDSGEVDYSIPRARFDALKPATIMRVIEELEHLRAKCQDRLTDLTAAAQATAEGKPCT